jgi:hypothetical protein
LGKSGVNLKFDFKQKRKKPRSNMPNFGEFFRRDKYAYDIKFDVDLAKFLTIITPNFRAGMDKFAPNLGKI